MQRLRQLRVAQPRHIEFGGTLCRACQVQLQVAGAQAAGHGQRKRLHRADQQPGHVTPGQAARKANVVGAAAARHRSDLQLVNRANTAQACQCAAQQLGGECGQVEHIGAATDPFEGQPHAPTRAAQAQALRLAAGAGLPLNGQAGIRCRHGAGDAPLQQVQVHAFSVAAKGHLPNLAALGLGEQLHGGLHAQLRQRLPGAALCRQQSRLHLGGRCIEGQRAGGVGAALEPKAQLKGADHGLIVQTHRLHCANGGLPVAQGTDAGAQAGTRHRGQQSALVAAGQAASKADLKARTAQTGGWVVGHAHAASAQAGLQGRLYRACLLHHRIPWRALAQRAHLQHDVARRADGLQAGQVHASARAAKLNQVVDAVVAGVTLLVADRHIASTHQPLKRRLQLSRVVGRVGGITHLAAGLPIQHQPKLSSGAVGRSQREQLALVHGRAGGIECDWRSHHAAQGQGESLPAAAAPVERELLHLTARDLHGPGFLDHTPVVAVGRIGWLRQPQTIATGGCGQGDMLSSQDADEFQLEAGTAGATDAHIALTDHGQALQCSLYATGELFVSDRTGRRTHTAEGFKALVLATPAQAVKPFTGELAAGV